LLIGTQYDDSISNDIIKSGKEELRQMIQRGGGKEAKKRRKSSVKDVTLLQDDVVEIEVPFDLLVFDSI